MTKHNIKNLAPYTRQLIFVAVAVVISIVILVSSYSHYSHAKQKKAQAIAQQDHLYWEINQYIEDKRFLDNIGQSFEQIKAQGFFGEEDRLSWAEAIKTTAQRLKLPNLKYSIRPQQEIADVGDGISPDLLVSQSIMDIEADLLHEGDFITMSEQLSRMPGLFRVLACDLRKEKEITLTEPSKNIGLKCSLAWNTAKYSPREDTFEDDEFDLEFF